jgi:hypothetical protein
MLTDADIAAILRAVQNRTWAHPYKIDVCIKRGLAKMGVKRVELTGQGTEILKRLDTSALPPR